jgi:hypothetical protein
LHNGFAIAGLPVKSNLKSQITHAIQTLKKHRDCFSWTLSPKYDYTQQNWQLSV